MKKIAYTLVLSIIIVSCSTKKTGITQRTYHRMTSWYNTIFNGKETLLQELESKKQAYRDDFTKLLKIEPIDPFQSSESNFEIEFDPLNIEGTPNNDIKDQMKKGNLQGAVNSVFGADQTSDKQGLDRVIEKGKRAIGKHSMLIKGKEYNSMMADAYLVVAKAYYFKDNSFEAMNYLNYMNSTLVKNRKKNEAKIYMALAQARAGNSFQADEIYEDLKKSKLNKSDRRLAAKAYSQFLIDEERHEEAIEALEKAKKLKEGKYYIGRYNFIQAQLSEKLGKKEEAMKYYQTAFNKKPSTEIEIKSQIELAKYFKGDTLQYNDQIKFLKKLTRKGLYQSRKNELLYAMAVTSLSADKKNDALLYLRQSVKEKESDLQVRALAYQKIGDIYFSKPDYVYAGAYYDSVVSKAVDPGLKARIEHKNKILKDVIQKYYLVKRSDSILAIAKMSLEGQKGYFQKYIEDLKQEEERKRAELQNKMDEQDSGTSFQTEIISGKDELSSTPASGQKWYFYNTSSKQKGQSDFKRLWGDRALVDNWRHSKLSSGIENLKEELLGIEKNKNPRRFEVEYYTEKLPQTKEEIEKIKIQRDSAELALGIIYLDNFKDIKSGTETLEHLISTPPYDESLTLAAMYNLFKFNQKDNPEISKKYGNKIVLEYPSTKYAKYVLNPEEENRKRTSSSEAVVFYEMVYKKYEEGKYGEAKKMITEGIDKYPTDNITPKFLLLAAFCEGKLGHKQQFLEQLEKVSTLYDKSPEGKKTVELLKYFRKQEEEQKVKREEIPTIKGNPEDIDANKNR